MKRLALASLAVLSLALASDRPVAAHCEVPCGIFDDPARFAAMREDAATIEKAMVQFAELATGGSSGDAALNANQAIRWIETKETHATHVMHVIAQYFMAQRIKADDPRYADLLAKSHAVLVGAMKTKQSVDPAVAKSLVAAIDAFQKAYDTKPEPAPGR
jgi:nickel superoxide dismutase